jgi:isopenicillin-N N-acyltransferase-like protein
MPVVRCGGSPFEVGQTHGAALSGEIHAHLDRWMASLSARFDAADPRPLVHRFLSDTHFGAAIESHTPTLAEEIAGIAAGADLHSDDVLLLQLLDESWRQMGRAEHCTSFAVVEDAGWSRAGQTMDLESFRDGAQSALHLLPHIGPELLVVTMAGCVGLLGVARTGWALFVNALSQLPSRPDGLPVACAIRGALAHDTLAEGVEFLRRVPHATGQHYLAVSGDAAASLECSAAGVADVEPPGGPGRGWHTNHPLAGGVVPGEDDANSVARFDAVARVLGETAPEVGVLDDEAVEAMLAAAPVCRPHGPGTTWYSFATVLVELVPGVDPLVRVAPGPAATTPYTTLAW